LGRYSRQKYPKRCLPITYEECEPSCRTHFFITISEAVGHLFQGRCTKVRRDTPPRSHQTRCTKLRPTTENSPENTQSGKTNTNYLSQLSAPLTRLGIRKCGAKALVHLLSHPQNRCTKVKHAPEPPTPHHYRSTTTFQPPLRETKFPKGFAALTFLCSLNTPSKTGTAGDRRKMPPYRWLFVIFGTNSPQNPQLSFHAPNFPPHQPKKWAWCIGV